MRLPEPVRCPVVLEEGARDCGPLLKKSVRAADDGVGIEAAEQSLAKERFAGRLPLEVLVEKLGHSFWHHGRELDLSRSKIRELDALHADGFSSNLRELNLDGHSLPVKQLRGQELEGGEEINIRA